MRNQNLMANLFLVALLLGGCNPQSSQTNPLLGEWDTPFQTPPFELIQAEHYLPAFEQGMEQQLQQIDSITQLTDEATFANTIEALELSGALLKRTQRTFSQINAAESNEKLQAINREVAPRLSAHNDHIYLNERLFERVEQAYNNAQSEALDPQQQRLTELTYKRFLRAGAKLTADQKEELSHLNGELALLSVRFSENVLASNNAYSLVVDSLIRIKDLPSVARQAAADEAKKRGMKEKWVFTLSQPSMIPLLTHAGDSTLRQEIYTAYLTRCNSDDAFDNTSIIDSIVTLRLQKAQLMGYKTYAHYVLDDRMAKSPERAYALLDEIWDPAIALAGEEVEEMKKIKKRESGSDTFNAWDWWYYAEKVRKERYNINEEQLRTFLSLENVIQGVFRLCNRLWGITFRPASVPTYHKEVMAFEALDQDDTHLGILYLDLHPRAGKRGGAWCSTFRGTSYADSVRVAPVVSITCNFSRPANSATAALLGVDETLTFFHEFGHALHSLFSEVHYTSLGTTEWDFIELPSQIMENWAFEPEVLAMYARQHNTNSEMPEELVQSLQKSAYFNQGFETTQRLAAAYTDMDIHSIKSAEELSSLDIYDFEHNSLRVKRQLTPEVETRYHYPYFSHIFSGGYAAGYYGYMWAEVLDKDAYQAFVERGDIFDREIANRFRYEILAQGGSSDGMTLYTNFRGSEPDTKPLLRGRGLLPALQPVADTTKTKTAQPIKPLI